MGNLVNLYNESIETGEDNRTLDEVGSRVSLEESVSALTDEAPSDVKVENVMEMINECFTDSQYISYNYTRTKNIASKFYVNHGKGKKTEVVYEAAGYCE